MFAQLRWKLVAVFGVLILVTVLSSGLLAAWATNRRFDVLINSEGFRWAEQIAPVLEESYAHWGDWRGLGRLVRVEIAPPGDFFVSSWQSDDWWQIIAGELGVDQPTLTELWQQSDSLAVIAQKRGVDPERLVAAIVDAEQTAMSGAVERGEISKAEAQRYLAPIQETARQFVELSVQVVLSRTEAQWDLVTAIELNVPPEQIAVARDSGQYVVALAKEHNVASDQLVATLIQTQDGVWVVEDVPLDTSMPEGQLDVMALAAWSYVNPAELPPVVLQYRPVTLTQSGINWMLKTLLAGDKRLLVADVDGEVVFDSIYERVGTQLSERTQTYGVPLSHPVDGHYIGTAVVAAGPILYSTQQKSFMRNVNLALAISGLVGGGTALLVGLVFARRITQPVVNLTAAADRLAEGDLDHRVPVRSRDELGQMSAAFNTLAGKLEEQRALRNRLVDDIAHELNTPLSVIQLELEALRDGMQSPQEANERAKQEIALLRTLVNDLEMLSDADEGMLQLSSEQIDMASLIVQAVQRWQGQAAASEVVLDLVCADPLPVVWGDTRRLNQALGNLLANALQHTPPGGRIDVRCQSAPASDAIVTTVTDTGDGISPDDLPHIFERFYRADRSRSRHTGGRGLGLAIAKQIVEAHGGEVWVESTPSHGSTFGFRLPTSR